MYAVILIVILIVTLYAYAAVIHTHWRKKNVPYIPGVPFIGNKEIVFMQQSIGTYLHRIYEKTKEKVMGFYIMGKPCILIKDPAMYKKILVKDFHIFADRSLGHNSTHDPVGSQILFVVKNPDWKQIRMKMTSSFSSGKMKGITPLISKVGKDMIEYMKQFENQAVDMKEIAAKYSTDVITSCAFGLEGNCFVDENSPYRKASRQTFDFNWIRGISFTTHWVAPSLLKTFHMKFLDPFVTSFLREVFWERVKLRDETKTFRNDMIDNLLALCKSEDDKFDFGNDVVLAQAIQFFIAGFETTSTTVALALYELAHYKEIQDRLRKEILQTLENHNGVTYAGIKEMEYLDIVLQESLRKYPVLPFLDRKTSVDYKLPDSDIVLDKGTYVFISVLGVHNDPDIYPNPQKFDPDRFLPENKLKRPGCTYLPFGEGPRNCIGARFGVLSAKICLIHILSNFEVLKTDKTPKKIEFDPRGFLLGPTETISLRYQKINQ